MHPQVINTWESPWAVEFNELTGESPSSKAQNVPETLQAHRNSQRSCHHGIQNARQHDRLETPTKIVDPWKQGKKNRTRYIRLMKLTKKIQKLIKPTKLIKLMKLIKLTRPCKLWGPQVGTNLRARDESKVDRTARNLMPDHHFPYENGNFRSYHSQTHPSR